MTKTIKGFITLIFIASAYSLSASAQNPSLADVGSDKYTSEADGFQIAVPHQCMSSTTTVAGGRSYICDLKEGRLSVLVSPPDPAFKTEAEVTDSIEHFDDSAFKVEGVKIIAESPVDIGNHHGMALRLEINGVKFFVMSFMALHKNTIVVTGRTINSVANSEKLVFDAFNSFRFVTPKEN